MYNCAISDHSLVYLVRRSKKPSAGCKFIRYRCYKNYTPEKFCADLHFASWDSIDTSLTVDDAWESFKNILTNIIDQHAPIATKRARAETLPWLNADIRNHMKRRDHHHAKAIKLKTTEQWSIYRTLRNKTTSLIREAKRDYCSNLIEENKEDSAKLWKSLKSAISTNAKCSNIGCLDTTTGLTYEPKQIAQGLAHYFGSVVQKIRGGLLAPPRRSLLSPKTHHTFRLSTISEEFVRTELKKIRSSKSTGLADIPARLLKDGSEAIAKPLTLLMNRTISEGSIPSEWKHAVVTPVCKSDSKTDPANYRPISVLPVFSKILERAVHKMVYTYLQQHNLLSVYQSGFRSLHSTSTCLADVTNTLLKNIDNGQFTGLVF